LFNYRKTYYTGRSKKKYSRDFIVFKLNEV
jgi:hypothetical protein